MEYHTISTQFRMKYYVYQLRAINSEIPFYIGKGTDGRSKEHVAQARKGNMTLPQYVEIQRLWQLGIAVIDEVLFCTFSEQLAYEVERSYINLYVGQILNRRQVAEDYHPKRINKPI